jgi:hypothetical protein
MCVKGEGFEGVEWVQLAEDIALSRTVVRSAVFSCDPFPHTRRFVSHHRFNILTDNRGLQIHEHSPWHVFASSSLAEERIKAVVASANSLVRGHLSVRLNAMFQAVQLPACVADLDTCLADVD